ncbi:hydroxyacyl-thioester dehydratase type 2, mitochondrial [Ixodes scapularis]|nr:hydroxyacyl-thioester dehydratase type 2, mitochondrial [Ixodes scapularis]
MAASLICNGIFCRRLQATVLCQCYKALHVSVGDTVHAERTFTEADVETFAKLTGDTNPIHLDREYARRKHFQRRVVHGALINGIVSSVIGTKMPGPGSVVVRQLLDFPRPLFIGEPFRVTVKVTAVRKAIVNCTYECITTYGKKVMSGEVKLYLPQDQTNLDQ